MHNDASSPEPTSPEPTGHELADRPLHALPIIFVTQKSPADLPPAGMLCAGCNLPLEPGESWLAGLIDGNIVEAAHTEADDLDPTLVVPGSCAAVLHQAFANVAARLGIHQGLRPGLAANTWYLGDHLCADFDYIAMLTACGNWLVGFFRDTTGAAGRAPHLAVPTAGWCADTIVVGIPPTAYLRLIAPGGDLAA